MTPRILLIRLSSLGDIVLMMPLIRALRRKYPDAEIDLIVKSQFEPLARRFPGLTNIIAFDTKATKLSAMRAELQAKNYTHVLDLHGSLRSRVLRKLSGAKIAIIRKRPIKRWFLVDLKFDFLRHDPDAIGRYFETAAALDVKDTGEAPTFDLAPITPDDKLIAFCPGAKHYNKQWPPPYYRALAKELVEKGYTIECFGSADERELAQYISEDLPKDSFRIRCGEVPLEALPEEFARAHVAVTNDSALMHIAAAAGVPTVSMFGPTVRSLGFFPRAKSSIVLEVEKLRCRPCTTIGMSRCPKGHFRCMREIEPEQVMVAIENA
ncbi:MAG: glycosyltransferase family 9 protein [Bacteroidetes bacterium]|nr:glycosyltransferase family 9 protein [Bacteroidota bacterium]